MIDDVPVSDVLLEAAEYLCKLGSNLKLRSENLKEKRITRSKLKNKHAVQKAADKLLLICELSKKSLENVEVGVKKILRVCAKDHGPIPVNPTSIKREIDFFYIKDGSKKLRMSQKISLEHFKSVKVKARNMPLSKQEKYPVYFDCKLYRRRKKKETEARQKKLSENNFGTSDSEDKIKVDSEEDEESQKDGSREQEEKESLSRRRNSTGNQEEIREDKEKSKTTSESDNSTKYDKKQKYHNSKSEAESKKCDYNNQNEKPKDLKDDKPEKTLTNRENSHEKNNKDQSESKKKKHGRIVDDSSDAQSSEGVDSSSKKCSVKEEISDTVNNERGGTEKKKHTKIVNSTYEEVSTLKKESTHMLGDNESNSESAEEINEAKIVKSERRRVKTLNEYGDDSKKKHSNKEILDFGPRTFDKQHNIETVEDSSDDTYSHKKRKLQGGSSDEESKKERSSTRHKSKPQKNREKPHDKRDKHQSESKKKKKHARIVEDSSDEQFSEAVEESSRKPSGNEKSIDPIKDSDDTKQKHAKSVDCTDEYALEVQVNKGKKYEAKGIESSKDKTNDEEDDRDESKKKQTKREILDSSDDQHSIEEHTNKTSDKEKSPATVEDCSDDSHKHKKRKICHQMESSDEEKKDKELVNDSVNPVAEPQKPLLKLVDLSKLLKPDVLQADSKKNDCQSQATNTNKTPELCQKERKLEKKIEDELQWDQKRKEVLAFKPKIFHISVCRLPEFTNNLLVGNKIIKITQQGEIIATRSKDKTVTLQDSDKEDQLSDKSPNGKTPEGNENVSTNFTPDMNKVKSALLDSDSDKEEDRAVILAEAEKVKKTLLSDTDDSDSDGNIKEKKQSELSVVNCKKSEFNSTTVRNDNIVTANEAKAIDLLSKEMLKQIQKSDNKQLNTESSKVTESQESSTKTSTNKDVSPVGSDSEKFEKTQSSDKESEKPDEIKPSKVKEICSETCKTIDTMRVGSDIERKSKESFDKESEKTEEVELPKVTLRQESSSETSKNKDTTPVGSDKEKSPEKSPITPRSKKKRKNMMESMHAKKMLLTYSSSSDTEDENLKDAIKEIKNSLLEGSDEEVMEKVRENHRKKLVISSSDDDDDDDVPTIQKKKEIEESKEVDSETRENNDEKSSQVDAKADEDTSSSCKMGRSKTKPSSSSQNSDTQDTDKDIDGLTNLKTLTKSSRRRDSTSTSQAEDTGAKTRSKTIPKVPPIKMADLLQASTESSGESAGEGEDNDDLPPMTLNGSDAIDLGKDQLLDDSDASSTHNKSSDDVKQDDESADDDNPKAKRRKAIAISSDSDESGRRRNAPKSGPKNSDFSEEESEEVDGDEKRSKRKKKRDSDSDSSERSFDSGGKKKRRRIQQVDDSDGSGSGSENEARKHGRKNIRKVMGKDQLEEATKKAARREKERVARIAERQKLYNNLQFDESGKPDEVILDKVVLDFDPETKEPIIAVDRGLVKKLKPHQANGIKFMWDACFESAKRIKKDKGSGCILAHCMGLGKTLQVVTLTHTLLVHSELTGVRRVLVVCPLSTVLNWVNEFNMWLKHTESDCEVDVYELSRYKQNSERAWQLQQWFTGGGVCVLGYEMFRNLSADNPKKFRKKMLSTFQQSLVSPGPDLVVCDEGHLLKNEKTSLSQSMNRVKTLRRIVLTGTPLQNNLKEYYCMVQFVKPNLLGKYNEYLNRFVNPITNGQYTDSTEQDIRVMKRRSHVLHKMLDGAVQRRDYGVLAPFLPPKHENVLFITLSDVQVKLYQHYLDNYSRRPAAGKSGFLFPDFQSLQRIWTHPLVLKYNSERYEILQQKKRDKEEEEDDSEGSLADFIDDDSTPDESTTEESSDDLSDASDSSRKKNKKKKAKKEKKGKPPRRGTRANPVEVDQEEKPVLEIEEVRNENPTEWWMRLVDEEELEDMRHSHKLVLLFDILRQCEAIGDKLLVFSQSLYSLDLIEHFLGKVDEATQEARIDPKLGNHVGSWSPGVDYFRLDGSTSCENRSLWCKHFNREDNPRARLFLISTRAGGLGINLVAANRVVIFDVSWNPSHDVQSIFRVYRFGQKKPCYVYRFLAMGTMEEKIYERQVTKQAISKRVIDEQQIDRHYAENDLAELYKFEPKPPEPRPLPPLPKDRLFAEMLREHDKEIYKYHEHDSLLENKEEETLTEEERKAAWEDFENEKNRPPPAPFPSVWPMHSEMAPNPLLAQQQQQLAYAAIVAMLRKDMPNVNEAQIRDMLPLIYNANPALMQKMGEIYKYAPGMMNPMMNAMGGAAMGGMGGTSGLHYEPPWQRQQQDQQQMRLQQIMQHQNQSMNAKYYAGGLGSRDPVAMALQQQAAREIMLGEAAGRGRPRGRPPLARAPAPPADVVNLDSD